MGDGSAARVSAARASGRPARGGIPESRDAGTEAKAKLTVYVRATVDEALDKAWVELRQRMQRGELPEVSKSLMVDLALEIILADLEASGTESQLMRKLLDRRTR